jgi:tRNA G18 (ribose-2'-O)-methylase SpoU
MSRVREHIRIHDPHDPRISGFLNIRERDLVGREGKFVAEGRVVLNVLAESGHELESILILQNRVEGAAGLLASFEGNAPVYVTDQRVMDATAGFHLHRGIIAIAKRKAEPALGDLLGNLPKNALVVVLSAISNHDNMGSIFRNAAAFGADAVILDSQCCDPLYRKALRVSVGGVLKVPFLKGSDVAGICAALDKQGFALAALSPAGKHEVAHLPKEGKRAIILGTEGEGLPMSILASLPTFRIPMPGTFDSLNVATASGIALYCTSRHKAVENPVIA